MASHNNFSMGKKKKKKGSKKNAHPNCLLLTQIAVLSGQHKLLFLIASKTVSKDLKKELNGIVLIRSLSLFK